MSAKISLTGPLDEATNEADRLVPSTGEPTRRKTRLGLLARCPGLEKDPNEPYEKEPDDEIHK
jgi:hypothetical protein